MTLIYKLLTKINPSNICTILSRPWVSVNSILCTREKNESFKINCTSPAWRYQWNIALQELQQPFCFIGCQCPIPNSETEKSKRNSKKQTKVLKLHVKNANFVMWLKGRSKVPVLEFNLKLWQLPVVKLPFIIL